MKMKRFFVDTAALNLFVFCTAFLVEVVFSGIPWSIFWRGRLVMIVPNIITVEPYAATRAWLDRKLGEWHSLRLKRILRDTIVFVLYRVPLIFLVLTYLGAPLEKVIAACIVATLISGFTGRPYGIFLDWMRRMFGVPE